MNDLNCTIVISSCDKYNDTWKLFSYFLGKYWNDIPFDRRMITNTRDMYPDSGMLPFKVGEDQGWASNMLKFLDVVDTDYILYLQDDYWLNKKVGTHEILNNLCLMQEEYVKCLRLYPSPPPNYKYKDDALNPTYWYGNLGIIHPMAQYRVSLQAAFWEVQTLKSLIVPGENGWDMEIKGSIRAWDKGLFLSVYEPAISYIHPTAIKKGCWTRSAINLCQAEALDIDFSKRPIVEV